MTRQKWTWKNVSLPPEVAEKIAASFERQFFEASLPGEPDNVEVLQALGDLYTRQGFFEKGLEVDLRLVRIRPREAIYHYNLACSHSLLGQLEPAISALRRAIQLGYDNFEHISQDQDLENLKTDRRFTEIMKRLQEKQLKKQA